MTNRIGLLVAALGLAVASCGTPPATDGASAAAAAPPPSSGRVRLDAAQLGQVRTEELSAETRADSLKATGTVEFNGDRVARLIAPIPGQVQRVNIHVGDPVRRGEVLFVLSSREVAAAIADHEASHKDLDLAEKTHAMTSDLFEHQAASRMALQQSENDLAKARARVQQTEDVLRVLGLEPHPADAAATEPQVPMRAPIDGTVIDRSVTAGQFVGPDAPPLATIADLSSVWVDADVFERDLRLVAVGQRADVTAEAYPNDCFRAQVARIGAVVDAQTRTAKVRFLVANPAARLKPGMFASITLYRPASAGVISLPARAVFVENGRSFVYVQSAPGEFCRREIEAADDGGDRVRVRRGLQRGERVAADGVLLLRQLEAETAAP